jgi:hypothetical protein
MTSLADQTLAELGGARSVLARQKRDHIELDRLIHAVDQSSGSQRRASESVVPHRFPHASS